MGRPVMLSNGSLMVGLNEHGLVHDFYYPYVGLENLTTARSVHHKIGVWVNGTFSWADDGTWETDVDFDSDALISSVTMHHNGLNITLKLRDFVDNELNVFGRVMSVTNDSGDRQDVRVFMHQVFEISRAGRADTALYVPDANYILDYKGRCCLLVYGQSQDGSAFDQFAIGSYGIEGKEGTFKDAEDGELSGSPVEHGGVDSVMRFPFDLEAGESQRLDYWVIAADSQYAGERVNETVRADTLEGRLDRTRQSWHEWFSQAKDGLSRIDKKYDVATRKSLMVIKSHTDRRGGIIASCDSSIYNYGRDYYSYVWPRDGAMVIWPLIRLGFKEEAKKFFEFCRDIITPGGYLMHKYQPDRAIGSTWHPLLHGRRKELAIQEDETAIIIFMLGEFLDYSADEDFVVSLYSTMIQPACNFMAKFMDEQTGLPHATYDLWEEKFLTNTYTVAITYQALIVGAKLAERFEYPDDAVRWRQAAETIQNNSAVFFEPERKAYRKGYLLAEDGSLKFDNVIDVSSFYGMMMFELETEKQHLLDTAAAIERELSDQSPTGGTPRYEYDRYFMSKNPYKGNPWFVTTLWMAQYYVRVRQDEKARHLLDWTLSHTFPSGILSEQIDPETGQPVGVAPLVWSHAELVNTVLDLCTET